jgi:hypothetical protein
MFSEIAEHIPDRIPDLARRLQMLFVIAIGKHPPAPPPHAFIELQREPNPDSPHSPRHRLAPERFHHHVQMIFLHRVVNEPKPVRLIADLKENLANTAVHPPRPKRPDALIHPHRDM